MARNKRKDKKKTVEEIREENLARAKEVKKAATICLKDKKFKKYKDLALKYKADRINNIIDLDIPNPVEYAFAVQEIAAELRVLNGLLISVEGDANKEEK